MFKKVFGDKENTNPIRILLKCILDIDAKEIEILNPEVIGSSYYDKRTIVDLIVKLEDGTKIGIEMNTNVNKYLIDRNIFYMFKIMSSDMKKGSLYSSLNKHIQINIDCEGKHIKPIERYSLMERENYKILTDKIEIVRVNLPYYVEKCYNEDAKKLDYKDKFIGIIGIENNNLLKSLTEGDKSMEEIASKVEDFSNDEEIIGAYDAEWHKIETERVVKLANQEEREEINVLRREVEARIQEVEARIQEVEATKQEVEATKQEVEATKQEVEATKQEVEATRKTFIEEGSLSEKKLITLNMLMEVAFSGIPDDSRSRISSISPCSSIVRTRLSMRPYSSARTSSSSANHTGEKRSGISCVFRLCSVMVCPVSR